MEAGSFFLLPADGAVFQVNPVEYFNQLKDADFDPRFFQQFASDAFFQSLSDLERATGNGPLSEQWLAAAADQQRSALIDDHAANAYYRPFGIFSRRCHSKGPCAMVRCRSKQRQRARELTSCTAVYNTLQGGGRGPCTPTLRTKVRRMEP